MQEIRSVQEIQPQPIALITGASRGLGFEVAKLFARRRAQIVAVARGTGELSAAARELRRLGGSVLEIATDVSESAEDIVSQGLRRFGRIDVLVNNASELGPSPMPRLEAYPWPAFLRVLRVNVAAPLHLIQLVLPQMLQRGRGTIVNITSDAGVQAYPGWGGYGASKAALEHLSRTLAAELEGSGVRVYLVDPGDMNTKMHRDAEPGADLSHLPGPERIAPFILRVIDKAAEPFARFEARAAAALLST